MNLSDLTEAAQCGGPIHLVTVNERWNVQRWEMVSACTRCKAHPGIDPDVIQWNIWNVAADERHFFKGETNELFVVVQIDDL